MCPTRQPHWVFELPEDSRWHLVHDVLQNIWNKQLRTENVCVSDHVRLFEMTHCELRIRRYLPCCDDEAVHTSGLRNVREADFKWSNLQSGGSNCGNTKTDKDWWKICWLKVKLDLFFLPLTHLQVFVGCDPVPPHSQHTDDVMFVWEELCLLWRLLLQTHYTQIVKFTEVSRHGWNHKEPGLIWGIIQTSEDMLTDSSICLQPHTCSKCK